MKKKFKKLKLLTNIFSIVIGICVLYYFYSIAKPSHISKMLDSIKGANYFWVFLSMFLGLLANVLRAIRWRILLISLDKKLSFLDLFASVMVGHLANLGIPRSGDFFRAAIISNNKGLSIEKSLGTIFFERIFDVIIFFLITSLVFFLNKDFILSHVYELSKINFWPYIIIFIILALAFFLLSKLGLKFLNKLNVFLLEIIKTFKDSLKLKRKGYYFFLFLLIWVFYFISLFVMKYSVDGLEQISWKGIITAFVSGSIAAKLTNGGVGIFPIAVAFSLSNYGFTADKLEAFGWLVWISQTLVIICVGLFSYIYIRLKKYRE